MNGVDMGVGEHPTANEAESQGCLLIVAAFTEVALALEPVAAEAAARVMISPVLGDFVELRFLDLGPRPQDDDAFTPPAARIADEFTHVGNGAARNYFALVVADNSAAVTEQTIAACRANPIIALLPLRCRGLAAIDDRQPGAGDHWPDADEREPEANGREPEANGREPDTGDRQSGPATRGDPAVGTHGGDGAVIVPASGGWARRELLSELRNYAETLLHDFATGHEPGLTLAELGSIRSRDQEILLGGPSAPAADAERGTAPGPPSPPGAAAMPDPSVTPSPAGSPDPAEPARSGGAPPPAPASTGSSWTDVPRHKPRWHLRGWRRGHDENPAARPDSTAEPSAGNPTFAMAPRVLTAPVCLVLSGQGGHADWNRARALLIEVDKKLAAILEARFMVRALLNVEDAEKSPLREAGKLSRRDVKRPASDVDFARLLALLRTTVKRDASALVRSGAPWVPSGVVFFAVEPPLADAITAEAYQELAREASIIWALPAGSAGLLSPVFATTAAGIITDHPAAASEVTDLLRLSTGSL